MLDGNKVRNLRERHDLSIVEFAERMGVSHAMVSLMERGIKQPGIPLLQRMAEYFGCTTDELLKKAGTA